MSELILTVEWSSGESEVYEGLPQRQLERIEEEVVTGLLEQLYDWDDTLQVWRHADGRSVEILVREAE